MRPAAYWFSAAAIAVMVAISIFGAAHIPPDAKLPSHWNIHGDVDGYASRNALLVFLPLLAFAASAIFAAVPYVDPRKENLKRSAGLYYACWFGVVSLFASLHALVILSASYGVELDARFILLPISLLVIAIGNFMAKSRSTWFVGLRTPWTLTSEAAWIAANRATGWFFVLTGVVAAATAFIVDVRTAFFVLFAGLMASACLGIAISYLVWRKDQSDVK